MIAKLVRFIGGVVLLAAWGSASAAQVGGILYLNLDSGGDTLAYTNKGNIKAGGIVHMAAGIAIHDYANNQLETQLTIGMKADSVSASNGTVSFYRWPVELIQFYKNGLFRVGGGLTYHMNPKLECDIDYECNWAVKFDDALGYVGQVDFVVPLDGWVREVTIGARFTVIDYEVKDTGYKVDGNSIGLSLGVGF